MIDEKEKQERKKSPGSRALGTHLTSNEDTPCSPKMYAHDHRRYQSSLARWFARPRSRIFSGCRFEEEQAAGFGIIGDGRDDNDQRNCNNVSDCRVEGDNGNQSMESSVRSSPNMARREVSPVWRIHGTASVLLVSSVRCFLSRLGANLTSHVDRKTRRLNPWIGLLLSPPSYLFEQTFPSPYCHRDHPLC